MRGVYRSYMRLALTERACARAAADVHGDLSRGLNLLATISATAPWLGVLLTAHGITFSFGGINGPKYVGMVALTTRLADAMVPAGMALLVAILAWVTREQCRATITAFDAEMHAATLDLLNRLAQPPNTD